MESKGKNVDVSLNVSGIPQCDEASSSGYSDLPKRSEGQDVNFNLNISGAPPCDEAPSSSSSSGPTKSRSYLISSKCKDKVEDVNLDDLWKHIFELWKLREKGNHEKARSLGPFTWPGVPGWQKLKEIVSIGTDLPIEKIYGAVQAILQEIGRENVATAAPLVVACALERFDDPYTHTEEFWHLVKEMYDLAIVLKRFSETPEETQDVMKEATPLIVEGALVFSRQGGRRRSASEARAIRHKLETMKRYINTEFTGRVLTPIQHQRRSHLSKEYPTHAESDPFSQLLPEASHDKAPFSGSLNVSMKRKGKIVDVSLGDEALSDLPKTSEDVEGHFPWPDDPGLQKSKEIVSFGTDLRIKEIASIATYLPKQDIHERFYSIFTNREKCRHLLKEMYDLAIVLQRLSESAEGMEDVIQEAASLILEGTLLCCTQIGRRSAFSRFFSTSPLKFERALSNIRQKLNAEIALRGLTFIDHGRSPLSKEYHTRADNGQVEEDMPELEEADIHTPQVEEDLREPQKKACLDFFGQNILRVFQGTESKYAVKNHFNKSRFNLNFFAPIQLPPESLSSGGLQMFKMKALVAATNSFDERNKVGGGGFGVVYKGTHDGKQIAVKKMSFTDERSREYMKKQFENEKLLAKIQHRNVVNLLGCCAQGSEKFLVYEYLSNGSLDTWLSDPEKRKRLDWHKRFNIIEGIAQGLVYLHRHSQFRLFHRDIKASNILLDEKLNPKITDFGTAKPFPEDRSHVTATTIVGTFGYLAPEYAMHRQITVKVDVYSFGVVLLELLTGKLIITNITEYLDWVWSSYTEDKVADTIDRTITETWDKEEGQAKTKALRCFQVALLCIQNDAKLRPTMSRVITMLLSSDSLPVPTKPPLVFSPRGSCSDEVENDNSTMEK